MAIKASNPGMLKAIFDAIFNGGASMRNKESLQTQIALAPERALKAPLITGWPDGKGGTYSTSVRQQLAYNAKGIAGNAAELAAIKGLLEQVAQAANKGVAVQIDYARIDASIKAAMPELPEYELTPKEAK